MSPTVNVSFVLPVYNMEKFLVQCLDSLCQQTLKQIEIICVDDGSSDGSMDILRSYQEKDPRIRVFQQKAESFCAALPRNFGLSQARGEYVLVMDSDDYVHPELAEKNYLKAMETGADVVLSDAITFDTHTGEQKGTNQFLNQDLLPSSSMVFDPTEAADRLFLLLDGVAWNKLIRRSLIERNQLGFFPVHVVDDMNFTFSVGVLAEKIAVVPEVLLYYRVGNSSSQMANLHRDPLTPVKVLSRLYQFLTEKHLLTTYETTYLERGIGLCMFYFDGLWEDTGFFDLYSALQQQGEEKLGFSLNSLDLLENTMKKQWLVDVYTLTAEEFRTKQKEQNKVLSGKLYGIYGFGVRTSLVYDKIVCEGGIISVMADSSKEKQGQNFHSHFIVSPQALNPETLDYVVITTANYFEAMKATLIQLGFSPENIIFM